MISCEFDYCIVTKIRLSVDNLIDSFNQRFYMIADRIGIFYYAVRIDGLNYSRSLLTRHEEEYCDNYEEWQYNFTGDQNTNPAKNSG